MPRGSLRGRRRIDAFTVILCTAIVQSKIFKACDSKLTKPTDVRVRGCNSSPCLLARGKKLTAEADFIINESTNILTPRIKIFVGRRSFNYSLDNHNACDFLKVGKCPLNKRDNVTYALNVLVPKKVPKVKATMQFEFLNNNNNTIVCFKVDVKVVRK